MKRFSLLMLTLMLGAVLLVPLVSAQTGGGYDLTWSSIEAGGGQSSGGGYILNGTIGQIDVGVLTGSGFTLSGGFWSGIPPEYRVFLPTVFRVQ